MRTNDAESDLDRELARVKLRDVVIGSAVAAVLLVMMPGGAQQGAATTASARARVSRPLLPRPKPDCVKDLRAAAQCPAHIAPRHQAMTDYRAHEIEMHHNVD